MRKSLLLLLSLYTACFGLSMIILTGCKHQSKIQSTIDLSYPQLLSEAELLAQPQLLAGIYTAYPGPLQQELSPAPEGYTPFYISHYGRHGSRFQPNDSRYVNTRQRLRDALAQDNLTPFGLSLLPRIEKLCDYACGHGGMLTTVGARQHRDIAHRMYQRFPEVFDRHQHISARSSVAPRCIDSMHSFLDALCTDDSTLTVVAESDSCYMQYLSYDTPEMRILSKDKDTWYRDYGKYALEHLELGRLMDTIFINPSGLDSLMTYADLYWLAAGMQNLDFDVSLDDVFTPTEMLRAYRCVNYRMYMTCGNCALNDGIPASSATSLLRNILESADQALATDTVSATLRFGHDSNLLRLLNLMHIHNAANSEADTSLFWTVWQECILSPMAANLQLIFYRPTNMTTSTDTEESIDCTTTPNHNILVRLLLNENDVLLDDGIKPVTGSFYRWPDLRATLLSYIKTSDTRDASDDEVTINIQ